MSIYKQFFNLTEDYPTSFKKEEFEKISSFAGKYRYANERLPKIASGSGRAVFVVDDTKVIKIAKNKKGLAQNSVEAEGYLQNYNIVARVFDTDKNDFWVEMERAKKITARRFLELNGVTIKEVDDYLRFLRNLDGKLNPQFEQKMNDNEFVQDLVSLNADYDMQTGDMGRLSTYGEVVRDGKPKVVLVDFGLTRSVWNDYYRVR